MKFTILNISDRLKENIERTKNILSSFEYINDIEFCNGREIDARKIIEDMSISINWNPYDGRTTGPLPGEFGIWVSYINIFKYIVKNRISEMLVLEDDAIPLDNFVDIFSKVLKEAPKAYDFISLHSFEGQNQKDNRTDIGLKYLHKSLNQYSATQGSIFTFRGAKKILRLLKKEGIEYTIDCQIFRKSLEEKINGYSLKSSYNIIMHDTSIKSEIDSGSHRYK